MKVKNRINSIGSILVLSISVTASIVALEWFSAYYVAKNGFLGMDKKFTDGWNYPQPYVMFGPRSGYAPPYPTREKPKGEFRIFVLGGSTVRIGTPAIPRLLEEKFSSLGQSHVKVFNLGVIGSQSNMELARIVYEVADLKPDLIINYGGGNNIYGPLTQDPRPGYPQDFIVYQNNPIYQYNADNFPVFYVLIKKSRFLSLLNGYLRFTEPNFNLDQIREIAGWRTPGWENQIAASYMESLIKSQKIARAFGADFIAIFQPVKGFYEEAQFESFELREYSLRMRKRVQEEIASAIEKEKLNIIDLSSAFESTGHNGIFSDWIHLNQAGNEIIADSIYKIIKEKVSKNNKQAALHN